MFCRNCIDQALAGSFLRFPKNSWCLQVFRMNITCWISLGNHLTTWEYNFYKNKKFLWLSSECSATYDASCHIDVKSSSNIKFFLNILDFDLDKDDLSPTCSSQYDNCSKAFLWIYIINLQPEDDVNILEGLYERLSSSMKSNSF